MRRLFVVGALLSTFASTASADPITQGDQVTFGIVGAYIPAQNNLHADLAAIGHYVTYTHRLDNFYLGARLSIFYGWLPGGAPGQQYLFQPEVVLGGNWHVANPVWLDLEVGTGPLVNGGEGFATASVDHSYVRVGAHAALVKSLVLEGFVGPSFLLGATAWAVYPELALGVGWRF